MELGWVPGGCFQMGCGPWAGECPEFEKPVHEVCVDGFWMGTFEVTQQQWERVMGSNPSGFGTCGPDCPVERVSWEDVQEWLRRVNGRGKPVYRLPTEAEWEYAARGGGREERYAGGDELDPLGWYRANSAMTTHRVGQKAPNALGLHDMSGNVYEWCADRAGQSMPGAWDERNYYAISPRENPPGPAKGAHRIARGGCYGNDPNMARAGFRGVFGLNERIDGLGFRVVAVEGAESR